MSLPYITLKNSMAAADDRNGCTVIALATLIGSNYDEANQIAMNQFGRKLGRGMQTSTMMMMFKTELAKLGKRLDKVDKRKVLAKVDRHNYRVKTLTSNNIKKANLRGTHVILSRGHVAILKGGQVTDWGQNRATHVKTIYKVVSK